MVLYVLFYGFIYAEYCRKCISVWFGLDGGSPATYLHVFCSVQILCFLYRII